MTCVLPILTPLPSIPINPFTCPGLETFHHSFTPYDKSHWTPPPSPPPSLPAIIPGPAKKAFPSQLPEPPAASPSGDSNPTSSSITQECLIPLANPSSDLLSWPQSIIGAPAIIHVPQIDMNPSPLQTRFNERFWGKLRALKNLSLSHFNVSLFSKMSLPELPDSLSLPSRLLSLSTCVFQSTPS